jgi:hypothetical protein
MTTLSGGRSLIFRAYHGRLLPKVRQTSRQCGGIFSDKRAQVCDSSKQAVGLKFAIHVTGKRVESGEEMATRIRSGRSNLETAMALLIQNQAMFATDMIQFHKDFEEVKRRLTRLEQIVGNLQEAVANLSEAIREKIGFKK